MELPKNITQVGESSGNCRVYVEDYVVSYIKQMNRAAQDKEIALACYGKSSREQAVSYHFIYGACKVDYLQKEVRHLSQAQSQEIERQRVKYFPEHQFVGYLLLDGEMVEGFYICEQDISRYVKGYACFYEKNDSMLAYMLDNQKQEHQPEQFGQEKYERVKQRQEERRLQYVEQAMAASKGSAKANAKKTADGDGGEDLPADKQGERRGEDLRIGEHPRSRGKGRTASSLQWMRAAAVAVFLLLCGVGMMSLNETLWEDTKAKARDFWADLTEQKLPDQEEVLAAMSGQTAQDAGTLVAQGTLGEALAQENRQSREQDQTAPEQQAADREGGPETEAGQAGSEAAQTGTEGEGASAQGEGQTGQDPGSLGQADSQGEAGQEQSNLETAVQGQEGQGEPDQGQAEPDQGLGEPDQGQSGQGQAEAGQGQAGQGQTGQGQTGQGQTGQGQASGQGEPDQGQASQGQSVQAELAQETSAAPDPAAQGTAAQPELYVICQGDTLIGISTRHYGDNSHVQAICELNHIENPDNIQIGQKIILP